jgi:hypothetical protein
MPPTLRMRVGPARATAAFSVPSTDPGNAALESLLLQGP